MKIVTKQSKQVNQNRVWVYLWKIIGVVLIGVGVESWGVVS